MANLLIHQFEMPKTALKGSSGAGSTFGFEDPI
jgi:hypothetical protein